MTSRRRVLKLAAGMIGAVGIARSARTARAWGGPKPPEQPVDGPGGSARLYAGTVHTRVGEAPTGYHRFEPAATADGDPVDEMRPMVVFLHGAGAVDPWFYEGWIEHLVGRGHVVIYPDYQKLSLFDLAPEDYSDNVVVAVADAIASSAGAGRTPIDTTRTAVTGHSVGGVLTAVYAATAAAAGLPAPLAMMPVQPGGCSGCGAGPDFAGTPLGDLSTIPATIRALVIVGEEDGVVAETGARAIWAGIGHVPAAQKDYVLVRSDDHGRPDLVADHLQPLTNGPLAETDALDWAALWKPFDLLLGCVFDGETCALANGGSLQQRDLGDWEDGVQVATPIYMDGPQA
jgi:acetyl esterase/lipase